MRGINAKQRAGCLLWNMRHARFAVVSKPDYAEDGMRNLELQSWQALCHDALAENDPHKLLPLVMAAENAIFGRSQELMQSCDGRAEWRAMEDALVELRALQVEKLNFPE